MKTYRLQELAKTIRSKNAGVDSITFDIIFEERRRYEQVRDSGALTRESVARLFKVPPERITTFVAFDPAQAIKFSLRRQAPAGGPGETDLFGCQQYGPLFDVEIPIPSALEESYSFKGAAVRRHPLSKRLYQITFETPVGEAFFERLRDVDTQRLTYIPYLRLLLGDALRELVDPGFGELLQAIVTDRETGGFTVDLPMLRSQDDYIKWSTALSHLVGLPNFDAMTGNYFATFAVKDTDQSDSYLRQAYRRFTLHTDGTFVDEPTDWLLMMKMEEANAVGGFSRLLHLDDWEEAARFASHPCAQEPILYKAPPSKNTVQQVHRPTFFDDRGRRCICFIDQFAYPANVQQASYLHDLSASMEASPAIIELELPVGSLVVINNLFWLHGREAFEKHPELMRVLLRQRGCFFAA